MFFVDNNDEKSSSNSSQQLFDETEEFVIDCAVFESQRWLEIVTGEGCCTPENLPKSLFEGKQLRKLVNLLLKREVFIFNTPQSPPPTTIFERAHIRHEYQNFIYDNDWISQFLIIANVSFRIFPKYLFYHADLSNTTKSSISSNSLASHKHRPSHIEYSLHSSRDALRRICVTVLFLAKIYKKQYPDCNKTHTFDPEEGRKLLDLHKQKIGNRPIELQIRKRPSFSIATSSSMNFTNKKYGAQSLPRGGTADLLRNRRNSDFNMQSCSLNSPLQDIIAANEDVERWRERRRRSMNRTSESEVVIEESKPLYSATSYISCSEPLHVQASPLPPPLPNLITHPYLKDTQEQIIIASPQQQRTEGLSQDSGLENSTPEVSPPGAPQSSSSRNHWRNESESSLGSFSSDKFHLGNSTTTTTTTKPVLPSTESIMTQKHFVSTKRSLAPSPPTETSAIQQFSSLTLETHPIECNANAKFICRKDYSEAAICKAVVAQGALEETSAKVKATPMTIRTAQGGGKYSSVRIEVEATRENHAKVAAIKSVSSKEHQKTSGNFKPMCELIDEDLQRRHSRSPCSLQSSISPASSSKSSDFGADNRSLDRMSFGSGGHLYGNDYKVVALNAKPEPGKLTEFVPEVERNKPSEREEYVVSSYGSANGATRSPPLDAAVVRNWELSDEESPSSKSPVNNNNTEKQVKTATKIVEHLDTTKYDYPHLGKVFALGKSKDLEYSPDIPVVIIPPYPKSGDKKKRSKSIESNRSAKSVASNKSDSTFVSFKSAASKSFSQRSKTSSKGIPVHSDTDSLQSPEPVLVVNTSQVVDSEDEEEEERPVIHITKKAQEIDEVVVVVNDSSSSIEDVSKENTLKVVKSTPQKYHPRTTIEVEEETLHYAESQVNLPQHQEGSDDDLEEEQQYANINTDTLRSNRSLDISEMHNLHPIRPQKVKPIEREDTAEFERYTPTKEPLFYDTVAKYGFDPSGGYHVPKQLYRRDVPIRIEEPRHVPKSSSSSNTMPTKPLWNSHPLSRYREEDETKISRVTYRFYDRDMHELSSNTFVDKAKRATRSVEDGIEHPIYQLETSYYPQSASADRKFIRSQGYPTPFNANSKNYVKADSKFQILPKTEERLRPKIVKKDLQQQQQYQKQHQHPYGLSDTHRVHNDSRHPSGAPQPRVDLFSEEPKPIKEKSQSMLTVSGKLRCAHCTCELGRGSAMIIEALGLFYHINCFRCHVCDKMLGTGSQTTDVRVRDGKLHCEKCYSNEDIGVRLSEI